MNWKGTWKKKNNLFVRLVEVCVCDCLTKGGCCFVYYIINIIVINIITCVYMLNKYIVDQKTVLEWMETFKSQMLFSRSHFPGRLLLTVYYPVDGFRTKEIKRTFGNAALWLLEIEGVEIVRNICKCVKNRILPKREKKECHPEDNSVLM